MRNKEELLSKLKIIMESVKNNKKQKDIVKKQLAVDHKVLPGDTVSIINNPEEFLNELDIRELSLLTKELIFATGYTNIELNNYFSENELNDSKSYDGRAFTEEFELPYTFKNVLRVDDETYIMKCDIEIIKKLYTAQVLTYDPDIQRELTKVKLKDGGYRFEPTLYKENVDEICDLLLKGLLLPTTLIWNVKPSLDRNSDEDELVYNANTMELTLNKGNAMAILDGYHRINGLLKALRIRPNINFEFTVQVCNYGTPKAKRLQLQIAKATPISQNRKIQLEENYSNMVVDKLNAESDLRDRISIGKNPSGLDEMLISYDKLSHYIDKNFKMGSKKEARIVGNFLVEFFNELIGIYQDDFVTNMPESRKYTLVNNSRMFAGYVLLASKMYYKGIDIEELEDILSQVDFSRNNNIVWVGNGLVQGDKKTLTTNKNTDKSIERYFDETIKLPETVTKGDD